MAPTVDEAFLQIEALLSAVDGCCAKNRLRSLVRDHLDSCDADSDAADSAEETADAAYEALRVHLRVAVPQEGVAADETITLPGTGAFAGDTATNSRCVDAFLYDDDHLESLADDGRFSFHYCGACGSRDARPLEFHSHSLSKELNKHVFTDLLTGEEVEGKTLLDVGSRTGALLFAAALYQPGAFARIVGVELSPFFCGVQRAAAKKFAKDLGTSPAVEVVEGDVFAAGNAALLAAADVLVFNNVFQFFATPQAQREAWAAVKKAVKKGAILVTVPSLEETLELAEAGPNDWATPIPVEAPEELEGASSIHKYRVK